MQRHEGAKRRKTEVAAAGTEPERVRVLPREFLQCSKEDLLAVIARMLATIVGANDARAAAISTDNTTLTRFHSRSPPQISIHDYLARLAKYSMLTHSVLLASVYYIDLLSSNYPAFALNSLTVHRFLLAATTVASKALCDSFCSNAHYAKVGGVNVVELNMLEVEFLTRVQYRVVPRDFNYDNYRERKNSTGALEDRQIRAWSFGIRSAAKILYLYYTRMVAMMGQRTDLKTGAMDDAVFQIEPDEDDDEDEDEDDDDEGEADDDYV